MPSNDIPDQDHPQQALGSHRIVWRGDGPMIAVDEDGVVTLHKLHVVPDALWNSEFWDVALPDGPRLSMIRLLNFWLASWTASVASASPSPNSKSSSRRFANSAV